MRIGDWSSDVCSSDLALGGTWHGRTAMCLCPAHADRTPSLSIRQGDRGILVTCFAGCDREDVLRELRRMPLRQRYSYRDTPARASGNAARLWEEGLPISGTLAERYLTLRRLEPPADRSEERRGGKEGSTCRTRWSTEHEKKKNKNKKKQ